MNRAEKQRREKRAVKTRATKTTKLASHRHAQTIEQSLVIAQHHYNAGRLSQAESIYQQILQIHPNQPDALMLLGLIAHQQGNNDIAVNLILKAISVKPDHVDAHYILANVHRELGKLDEAVSHYRKAISIKPDFIEAQGNLGNTLRIMGKPLEAAACFENFIDIMPNLAEPHFSLGVVLRGLGRLDDAAASYQKAIAINSSFTSAEFNLSNLLLEQGKINEAINLLQTLSDKNPDDKKISDRLIEILNDHPHNERATGTYAIAQESLLQLTPKFGEADKISTETVQQLYRQCHAILKSHKMSDKSNMSQIYRGVSSNRWKNVPSGDCIRNFVVFDTFNIIPKYCFDCYKVSINPRTAVELFKLMLLFDRLELRNDNTRKCFVEVRPEISGAYKGLIYCQSLDEAKECLIIVQRAIATIISKSIPCSLQRGCSEFSIAYPEFAYKEDNSTTPMKYNKESLIHEEHADKNLIGDIILPTHDTNNHVGITLQDALVMGTWLAYAAMIGDLSYRQISASPVRKLTMWKRPPFQHALGE